MEDSLDKDNLPWPRDGYKAKLSDEDILVRFLSQGEHQQLERKVWDAAAQDWNKVEETGASDRRLALVEAVCRYFTTGGNWKEAESLLEALRGAVRGGLKLGDTSELLSSVLTEGGVWEHTFDVDGKIVVWSEGEFVDELEAVDWLQSERDKEVKDGVTEVFD